MSDKEYKELKQKFTDLEKRVTEMGKIKPAKDKKTRKPSEYNKFMASYFSKHKDPKKSHKDLFAEAAKAWNTSKK